MKFDPLVKVEQNKVYMLADGSELKTDGLKKVSVDEIKTAGAGTAGVLTAVVVPWSKIEIEPGAYNEELLADLRTYLKNMEEAGNFAFILPVAEKEFADADQADSFIAAMVHCARRIKDCESVIGYAVVPELLLKDAGKTLDENSWTQWFINEMNKKHGHYVYLAEKASVLACKVEPKTVTNELALY